jgi:hypothetical protein
MWEAGINCHRPAWFASGSWQAFRDPRSRCRRAIGRGFKHGANRPGACRDGWELTYGKNKNRFHELNDSASSAIATMSG